MRRSSQTARPLIPVVTCGPAIPNLRPTSAFNEWTVQRGRANRLLFLALAVVILPFPTLSCADGKRNKNHLRNVQTSVLFGMGQIAAEDRRVIFMSVDGVTGSWNIDTAKFTLLKEQSDNAWAFDTVPGDDSFFVGGRVWNPQAAVADDRDYFQMTFVDPRTLKPRRQFRVPSGPPIACWLSPTLLAACSYDDPNDSKSDSLRFWRVDDDSLRQLLVFSHPAGKCVVAAVQRVTDDIALLHVLVDKTDGRETKKVSEIILFDVSEGRILKRANTRVPAVAMRTIQVSKNGKYAAAAEPGKTIEFWKLSPLALVKTLCLVNRMHSGVEVLVVSNDGRHLAFGSTHLDVWDTTTGDVYLVDKLSEDIVTSVDFRLRREDQPPGMDSAFAIGQYCLTVLEFTNDDQQLVGVTRDGLFTMWDLATRNRLEQKRFAEVEYLGNSGG